MAKHDVEVFRKRIPDDRAEFFIDFSPWPEDCQNWERSVDERFGEGTPRQLRRTVWDDPKDRQGRVMIDVLELDSAYIAIDALAETLELNQLAVLPEGPASLGYVSFVHPESVPPATFFVQGNLLVSIISYTSEHLDVMPWASRITSRLLDRPREARHTISLDAEHTVARVGQPSQVRYTLPWRLGDHGFIKIFTSGARLSREKDGLFVTPVRRGEVSIDILATESGRETHAGQLRLSAE